MYVGLYSKRGPGGSMNAGKGGSTSHMALHYCLIIAYAPCIATIAPTAKETPVL